MGRWVMCNSHSYRKWAANDIFNSVFDTSGAVTNKTIEELQKLFECYNNKKSYKTKYKYWNCDKNQHIEKDVEFEVCLN
jgi:hypothetical protein